MNTLAFAWRSLVRQPARAMLGILGVAAVGALLFDMLLLSQGLVISMRDLLDRSGFDVRVTATQDLPGRGPGIADAARAAGSISSLATVRSVITVRFEDATLEPQDHDGVQRPVSFLGAGGGPARPWTVLRGTELRGDRELVLNDAAARAFEIEPGHSVVVRASCSGEAEAPPPIAFRVAAVVEFPFDTPGALGAATTAAGLSAACGAVDSEAADFVLVASRGDPAAAVTAIAAVRPDLHAITNAEAVGRLQEAGFTYFRQISTVLTTVTVSFALLLITVLLTVSVNQRLAEIAALRALGFSRRRVAADVLCESALIVGLGGLLSLPIGAGLAGWLDQILKRMPGIPADLHFFVFEPRALQIHVALLAVTAVLAAIYPIRIASSLPIAATLRNEVIS
jgi:putative ABC transport system permease protein